MTPDVAAVADPFTGVRIVLNQQEVVGGGTSQSAPIWAGMAAVMNQYLIANGGQALGDLNPMLYRIAAGAPLPGFRDITLGGNAVADARARATTWSPGSARPTSTTWSATFSYCRRRPDEHRTRTDDRLPTAECRVCQTDVPAGEYCGLCGCHLTPRRGEGPDWLRIRDFGAAPGEHLLQPSLASSLFPHLPPRSRTVFRVGLAVVLVALVAFALLRLPAALITVAALGFPFLFLLYLRESDGVPRHPDAHLGAHRGAGHRARRRLGAADGRDGRPVVRNCVGRWRRRGPHAARRHRRSRWAG